MSCHTRPLGPNNNRPPPGDGRRADPGRRRGPFLWKVYGISGQDRDLEKSQDGPVCPQLLRLDTVGSAFK